MSAEITHWMGCLSWTVITGRFVGVRKPCFCVRTRSMRVAVAALTGKSGKKYGTMSKSHLDDYPENR